MYKKNQNVAPRGHASFVCSMGAEGVTWLGHSWEHKHLIAPSVLRSVQGMPVNDSKNMDFRGTNTV